MLCFLVALVDMELKVVVLGVVDTVLLIMEVVEAVMEVLVVVALTIAIIVKELDIRRIIATLFIPSSDLLLLPMSILQH